MDKPNECLALDSVEEVLAGSLTDIAAGRVDDFDVFLASMTEKVRTRVAEIEANVPSP